MKRILGAGAAQDDDKAPQLKKLKPATMVAAPRATLQDDEWVSDYEYLSESDEESAPERKHPAEVDAEEVSKALNGISASLEFVSRDRRDIRIYVPPRMIFDRPPSSTVATLGLDPAKGVMVVVTTDQYYTMSSKPLRARWAGQVEPAMVDAKGDPSGGSITGEIFPLAWMLRERLDEELSRTYSGAASASAAPTTSPRYLQLRREDVGGNDSEIARRAESNLLLRLVLIVIDRVRNAAVDCVVCGGTIQRDVPAVPTASPKNRPPACPQPLCQLWGSKLWGKIDWLLVPPSIMTSVFLKSPIVEGQRVMRGFVHRRRARKLRWERDISELTRRITPALLGFVHCRHARKRLAELRWERDISELTQRITPALLGFVHRRHARKRLAELRWERDISELTQRITPALLGFVHRRHARKRLAELRGQQILSRLIQEHAELEKQQVSTGDDKIKIQVANEGEAVDLLMDLFRRGMEGGRSELDLPEHLLQGPGTKKSKVQNLLLLLRKVPSVKDMQQFITTGAGKHSPEPRANDDSIGRVPQPEPPVVGPATVPGVAHSTAGAPAAAGGAEVYTAEEAAAERESSEEASPALMGAFSDAKPLLQWLLSSKLGNLQRLRGVSFLGISCHKQFCVTGAAEREARFQKLKREAAVARGSSGSFLAFHGSESSNWHGILRSGLKNMSGTQYMSNGASFGNGVYLADDFSVSLGYSDRNRRHPAASRAAWVTAAAGRAAAARANAANNPSSTPAFAFVTTNTGASAAAPSAANAVSAGGGFTNGVVDTLNEPLAIVAMCEVIDRPEYRRSGCFVVPHEECLAIRILLVNPTVQWARERVLASRIHKHIVEQPGEGP